MSIEIFPTLAQSGYYVTDDWLLTFSMILILLSFGMGLVTYHVVILLRLRIMLAKIKRGYK